MAQMLLEQPIQAGIRMGHLAQDYVLLGNKLHRLQEKIAPEMRRIIDHYELNPDMRNLMLSSIPPEGSYHRGSLISIASESQGKPRAISLAAAGELFYWATAWLDDIADGNTFRQDTPSMREWAGDAVALYGANALYGVVMKAIIDCYAQEPAKLVKIMDHVAENFHVINKGQARDMLMATQPLEDVAISEYITLIEETTGVDVATSLAIGGIAGDLDETTIGHLYQFGLRLGTLAQIRDDVLDYCSATDEHGHYIIGKLPLRDALTGKKRLPLLLTKDPSLRLLPAGVYDTIEKEFTRPRVQEALSHLHAADLTRASNNLLESILTYWSDIRLFQKLAEENS